ncbi:MAG: DUF4368 domain-containing protein [Clostridia bacterium]|nr:DUF4368 domain-containing protein [Clostridia bacterium]
MTPTIIREFVDKIYVHQAVDFEGQRIQQIDIAWNFIGVFDPPESDLELIKGNRIAGRFQPTMPIIFFRDHKSLICPTMYGCFSFLSFLIKLK